ncbi:MAG: hypothetical protein KID00_17110 [Clostridium argentinense]|uniref:DUF4190 domain-containing protein n=2 Tax=Clostridium faecium TaxID=2762223 RepID=A0ABR8YP35_9CLOT|nr:hypothetical protein [Clostridium butanoliproducens]MBD8045776.1 hypothetical protein [Clostridium faecium]MBS5825530.1 hypothetical protein [Clostridium argentinense]MDU1350773.1 hypothetical protein [Clostridium argentinense]
MLSMSKEEKIIVQKKAYNISFQFTLLSACLIALSPQFFGPLLAIVFIIPIYMAIKGIKNRRKSGYLIAMGIVPIALGVSMLWIKYFIYIIPNLNEEMLKLSSSIGISFGAIKTITIICSILGIVSFILSITTFTSLIKNKKIFNSMIDKKI